MTDVGAARSPVTITLVAILALTQVAMFATLRDVGTFVDEVWYFRAAWLIEHWVQQVVSGETSLRAPDATVWEYNFEHPPFAKWVYAGADALFGPGPAQERYGPDWDERVDTPGALRTAMEPGLLGPVAGARVGALLFLLLAQVAAFRLAAGAAGPAAGLFAAAALPLSPHVFGHAHVACLDLPEAALQLATLAAVVDLVRAERVGPWSFVPAALLFGGATATKLNAVFLVAALVPWLLVAAPRRSLTILSALAVGAVVIFFAAWPYLWSDPLGRLRHLAEFHLQHRSFPVYFFGELYDGYTAPRAYLPATLILTTPIAFLALAAASLARVAGRRSVVLLLLLSVAAAMLPFVVLHAPAYDGVRNFLLAPLVICVLAGVGFATVANFARRRLGKELPAHATSPEERPTPRRWPIAITLAGVALLGSAAWSVRSVHPYPLAYYNAFVGGPRAGQPPPKGVGLESTCWGAEVVTPEVVRWLNDNLPVRATIDWNSGAYTALREYQRYGMLRSDFQFATGGEYSVLETNQAYWTNRVMWKLFNEGHAGPFHLVKAFGLPGIDLVRIYQRAAAAQ